MKVGPKLINKKNGQEARPLKTSSRHLCYSSYSINEPNTKYDSTLYKGSPYFDSTSIEVLNIPENDRRILEILALKKEKEIADRERAHQKFLLWETSQNERIKAEKEKKLKWQKYVKEKRKTENLHNVFRMEGIKESLRESQKQLEDYLRKRDNQIASSKKKQEDRKQCDLKRKLSQELLRRSFTENNFKCKKDEDEEFYRKHIEELEEKLKKAESERFQKRRQAQRRVASANRCKAVCHQENMLQFEWEEEKARLAHLNKCRERESRARERIMAAQLNFNPCGERIRKHARAEEQEKAAHARIMYQELSRGMEDWQDKILLLQWADHKRAEAAVSLQREQRRLKVEIENKERKLQHEQRFKKVKEAEMLKEQCAREIINAKEEKMMFFQRKREQVIHECRAQAQMTAELREHLRRTLSPETFDRKVARAALESRMSSRAATASPSLIASSHFHLG